MKKNYRRNNARIRSFFFQRNVKITDKQVYKQNKEKKK